MHRYTTQDRMSHSTDTDASVMTLLASTLLFCVGPYLSLPSIPPPRRIVRTLECRLWPTVAAQSCQLSVSRSCQSYRHPFVGADWRAMCAGQAALGRSIYGVKLRSIQGLARHAHRYLAMQSLRRPRAWFTSAYFDISALPALIRRNLLSPSNTKTHFDYCCSATPHPPANDFF